MPPPGSECVRVAVRCRPLSEREAGQAAAVSVDASRGQVTLETPGGGQPRAWTFDLAFGPGASQAEVYAAACSDLVDSALAGYNATLFAYGQTGTGKTHTMEGSGGGGAGADLPPGTGVIPRAFRHIFQAIGASADQTFLVRASMLEIYNEEIRDLLSKNPKNRLELREAKDGGVYVQGLNTFVVKSEAEIASVLEVGRRNRTVGATLMNQDSSRSHSVFTVTIEAAAADGSGGGGAPGGGGGGGAQGSGIRVGKLNLVDLAGSERQAKTGAAGERLKEASKINLSLSALGNVISALVDGKSGHVPYRDSKLTRLLQDSLGGNTRTVMVANVGPAASNADESLATLRYANRAKNIRNQPRVNEDPKDAMLREFQEEIARLKAELAAAGGAESSSSSGGGGSGGGAAAQAGTAGGSLAPAAASPAAAVGGVGSELGPEEVAALRQQLEAELRADWSSSGSVLDDAAVAEIKREVQVQLAGQVKQARAERRRAAEEAARLGVQVQQRSVQVQQVVARKEQEAARNAELAAKLQMLEGRLLHGEQRGGLDQLARQAAAQVSRQEAELRRQRAAEAEASRRIAALEGRAQEVQSHTHTLQEEAEAVSAQLAGAEAELAGARAELGDVYAQWERDREELVEQIRALHYNLALKALVIDAFVPQEEVAKLMRRMTFNAEDNSWSLRSAASAGQAGSPTALPRRPASASAGPRTGSAAARRSCTPALLQLELDVPERRVLDLSHVQFALDAVTMA